MTTFNITGRTRFAASCLAASFIAAPVMALAQAGQPAPVNLVTDGRPWNMTMVKENRTMRLTLNPDGTGRMEGGPMTLTPSWRQADGRLCLKPMAVMPERCITLRRDGTSIVGIRDGEVEFRLQRP